MNTISLCMICKNEQANIGILLDQVCPVLEEVIVVDTGSTDDTLKILSDKQLIYPNLKIDHFTWVNDFSKARNYSFSLATMEYVMWVDSDDQVDQEALKNFKDSELNNKSVDCWILDYIYSSLPDGSPHIVLGRERIVKRSLNPKWCGAIHECIAIYNMRHQYSDKLKITHNQKGKTIDYNRNVRILESEYAKNPNDPRTAYYYGKELFDRINPKGLEVLKHYLTLDGKYWDDLVNAQFRLACDDLVNGRYNEAFDRANQIFIADNSRERAEYYWIIGRIEQLLGNFKSAIRYYNICLDLKPESPRVINKEYYTWNPMLRLAECYIEIGDVESSMRYFDKLIPTIGKGSLKNLESKIISHFKPINGLIIIDFIGIRNDSYNLKYFSEKIDIEVDGIICNVYLDDLASKLKTRGFYWHLNSNPFSDTLCQTIGQSTYKSHNGNTYYVYNSIRKNENSKVYVIPDGDENFGPYRIRLRNLRNSLIKNGNTVKSDGCGDYYISHIIPEGETNNVKILDVCEWLPESDYKAYGVDNADLIICSSKLLSQKIKEKFPNKKVDFVDDHIDMLDSEWL